MPGDWTFLSPHALVLLEIAQQPTITLRELADRAGVTERWVAKIVDDLEADGYLSRERVGQRYRYEIDTSRPLRHPRHADVDIRRLLLVTDSRAEIDLTAEAERYERVRRLEQALAERDARIADLERREQALERALRRVEQAARTALPERL